MAAQMNELRRRNYPVKLLKNPFGGQQESKQRLEAEEAGREQIYASYRGIKRKLLKTASYIPIDKNGQFGM